MPRFSRCQFVVTWNASGSLAEVAQRLGQPIRSVSSRGVAYRRAGLLLKPLPKRPSPLHLESAARLAALRQLHEGDGCRLWTGNVDKRGHGRVKVRGVEAPVHRVAYEHAHGPVPPGHEVRQTCKNPLCTAPAHLVAVQRRGEAHQLAKLTDAQAAEMRRKYGRPDLRPDRRTGGRPADDKTCEEIGREFGISTGGACRILKGRSYHAGPELPHRPARSA